VTRFARAALALSGALALTLPAVSAGAAPSTASTGQVSVNTGSGWTHDPTTPLFDFTHIVPGWTGTATLGVRNDSTGTTSLSLKATNVVDNENGCNHPESAVDTTCTGDDTGELSREVTFALFDDHGSGTYDATPSWTGSIRDLEQPGALGTIAAGATRRVRIVADLPRAAGNDTQSDTVSFDLLVRLDGTATVAVEGTKTVKSSGPGIVQSAIDKLPFTGTPAERLVALALSLLLAGAALTMGARHWRRPQSA
jgi:hypothetical protein